jgi:glycosyltransferase involved in cell wall biosynthesis
MKIIVISTTIMPCPPPGYSGLEMIAWQQAKGLAGLGHKVTLVAPIGSTPPEGVDLHGTTLGESEAQAYSGYWQKLLDCDAICDHSWNKYSTILKMEGRLKAPSLLWAHAPIETMFNQPPPIEKPCFVAISRDQAGAIAGHLGSAARVCYNGVDTEFYKSNSEEKTSRYLFLARMSRLKGPHVALAAAKRCHVPLDLVGDDKLVEDPGYALRIRAGCEGSRIVYHGEKARKDCIEFFSTAKALLHCNNAFREPFGLSPVEAQLCGCPVIAADHGSIREIVKEGETGFFYRTFEELEDIVKSDKVSGLSRAKCREWASQFSTERFVKRTDELLKEAVETGGW